MYCLGELVQMRQSTIFFFRYVCLSYRLSASKTLAQNWRIFTKNWYLRIFFFFRKICQENSSFHFNLTRVTGILCFLLGNSSRRLNFICRCFETFCLFHLHRQVGVEWLVLRNVEVFRREKFWLQNSLSQYEGGWQGRVGYGYRVTSTLHGDQYTFLITIHLIIWKWCRR